MKTIRKISKQYYLKQIMSSWLAFYMFFCFGLPAKVAMATPEGGNFTVGTGDITQGVVGGDNTVVVNQATSVIEWGSPGFGGIDTSPSESLSFSQIDGLSNSAVLNRIMSGNTTQFDGALNGMGMRIFVVNPAGIIFGGGASVNVTQLVASTLKLTDDDFINGLNNGQFKFTDGMNAGCIENHADISVERLALIGKEVINKGELIATNGYVVLAAGDTVLLTENGSNVSVAIEMPVATEENPEPDIHAFKVNNSSWGDGIKAYGENAQVVLAAGDVWSAALVKAYSEGGSDAAATVDITAVGDVDIEDNVIAEAIVAVNDGDDNANAAVNITAGGNVEIDSDGSSTTEVRAEAQDGVNNSADVVINAGGDVCILAQDGDVKINAEAGSDEFDGVLNQANVDITGKNVTIQSQNTGSGDDDATVKAYAHDGATNTAGIAITATGAEVIENEEVVIEGGDVRIESQGWKGTDATVCALAEQGTTNTATIDIDAADDVKIVSDQEDAIVKAQALNGLDEYDLADGAISGLTNTATVNITAVDEVKIEACDDGSADVAVEAIAKNVICLNPEIPEPTFVEEIIDGQPVQVEQEAVLDLAIEDLTNTANINITGGSVEIKGLGDGAEAVVEATAANQMSLDIDNYNNSVIVNLDVAGLENNAAVTINANGTECGDIVIEGDNGHSLVRAEAYNELEVENQGNWVDEGWTEDHGWWVPQSHWENHRYQTGCPSHCHWHDNWVKVQDPSIWHENWVWIENWVYYPLPDATLNLTVDGLLNNAAVNMTSANGNVQVLADEGWWQDGTASVEAEAYNLFEMNLDYTTTGNLSFNNVTNNAAIGITAGQDVEVYAEDGAYAGITAAAWNELDEEGDSEGEIAADNITNDAAVTVNAGDDVKVEAECQGDCSEAEIVASAFNEGDISGFNEEVDLENIANTTNTATVDITAGEDVKVIGNDCGTAQIIAETWLGTENTSGITINTLDGDVLVLGKGGDAFVEASAEDGVDNTATVGINAVGGDVKVIADGYSGDAFVSAVADNALNNNTAGVTITAAAVEFTEMELVSGGDTETTEDDVFEAVTYTEGGDVKAIADSGEAGVEAIAENADNTNTANVVIGGVGNRTGGDVKVIAKDGGEAFISAEAVNSFVNSADILICAGDELKVIGKEGGEAAIEASAENGEENFANIAACADGGVLVKAEYGGEAEILAEAKCGFANTAQTLVHTQGDVWVLALNGGEAAISAEATDGDFADALTAVCATGNIIVGAADVGGDIQPPQIQFGEGRGDTTAEIKAEAEGDHQDIAPPTGDFVVQQDEVEPIPTTANAEVDVVSKEGGVVVAALGCGEGGDVEAGITSKAKDATFNTAYTGVAAGADLSPASLVDLENLDMESFDFSDISELLAGNVLVAALGNNAKAKVSSLAVDGIENDAMTVICAPGKVGIVGLEGGEAKVFSGAFGDEGSLNTATTKVYAGDGEVGTDISADIILVGDGASIKAVTPEGFSGLCVSKEGEVMFVEDGAGATTIIDTYANRTDCPTCPPCPCEQGAAAAAVVPPLPLVHFPEISGCPMLMDAAAIELGIPTETIQIGFAAATSGVGTPGGFASGTAVAPNVQPCSACQALVSYAEILRDADGSHMAAMAQVFNTLAPADAPFTPEMSAAIASAFAENFDNPDMPQFAKALEYIEAFTGYVATLDDQMGSPVGDSAAFVMGKYGAPLTASNPNMTAYVQTQIAATQGI